VKRKHKIKSCAGCQENLQHCLGCIKKSHRLLVVSKTFGRSSRSFFSSIPHQKAALGDKPAIHHEDGAKDTIGEFNYFSPSREAALRNQCSEWSLCLRKRFKCLYWVNVRRWLFWVSNPLRELWKKCVFVSPPFQ